MLFYHSFKENDCVVTEIPCYNKVRADIRETVNELNPNAVLPECWPSDKCCIYGYNVDIIPYEELMNVWRNDPNDMIAFDDMWQ